MKLEQHVLHAIDDSDQGRLDSALMHACFSIDGTARKIIQKNKTGKQDYKNCLRQYYWLIEYFIGAGINLDESRWQTVDLDNGHGKKILEPDFADIVYHIFRCNHAHGEEVPLKYQLIPSHDGHSYWLIGKDGTLCMPDRVIWSLLAVSVFARVNASIKTEGPYRLTWGSETLGLGTKTFHLKDWWGREDDVRSYLSQFSKIRVAISM